MKQLYKIKWENILLMLFIPLAIIQFNKAHIDFKLVSVLMSITLCSSLAISIRIVRKEVLQEIKNGTYEPLVDLSEEAEAIKLFIKNTIKVFKNIKKEVIKQARYINDQAYILRASFK